MKKLSKIAIPLVLATLFAIPPYLSNYKNNALDGLLFDLAASVRTLFVGGKNPYDVVVIGVDEASLINSDIDIAGHKLSDLPRVFMQPVWAELIERLLEDKAVGARRIGFDFFFVWNPNRFLKDDRFEEGFRRAVLQYRGTDKIVLGRGKQQLADPYEDVLEDNIGGTALYKGGDGIARRSGSQIRVEEGDPPLRSFPALLSGQCSQTSAGKCTNIPDEFMLLPDEALNKIPAFRLMDVLRCLKTPRGRDQLKSHFKDKIILVGSTLPGEDQHRAPDRFMKEASFRAPNVDGCDYKSPLPPSENSMPGVFLLASAVESILNNRMPVQAPATFVAALIFVVTALISILALLWAPANLAILCVGTIITLFAGAAVALSFNWWVPTGIPDMAVVLAALASYTFRYVTEERKKNQLREQFEHYLDPNIIEDLAENPGRLQLGGETKDLSILFSDIRGFTMISEQHHDDPERLVGLINRYFDRLSNTIFEYGGTIDKYIGDCIMAFWNAPLDTEQHQLHACRAALAMQRAMIEVNEEEGAKTTGAGHSPASDLKIGIGINSGSCVVGNIGSEKRFDYSVLGDAVNLASRLEGQTKRYGVDIIVGPDTADAVQNDLCVLDLDSILVQGRNMAVTISTILDYQDLGKTDEIESQKSMHKKMLLLYRKQDWAAAINQVAECTGHFGGRLDDYYAMLLLRIEVLKDHPPGREWDGVFTAEPNRAI